MHDVGINLRRDRRQTHLAQLVDELVAAGMSESQIARELQTPKSYLAAMKAGTRGVGDRMAARIEQRFGKPEGWMDQPHEAPAVPAHAGVREALAILANAISNSTDIGRMKIATLLGALAQADHASRLRYADAIADELGNTERRAPTWEEVARSSIQLLDDSKGKDKVMAYLELVDAAYEHALVVSANQFSDSGKKSRARN